MNKTILTMLSIIVIIMAIIVAVAIYKPKENDESQEIITKVADEEILDDCTDEYQEIQNEMLQANSSEEKISPNCFITLKKSYEKCGHTKSEYMEIPEELVNKTKEDLKEKYKNWNIENYSDTEIILSKEEEGECGEHFMVRDKDGKVVIYEILQDGSEQEYEAIDIWTEYLTQTDKNNIQNGIRINGKQALNQLIEDFE